MTKDNGFSKGDVVQTMDYYPFGAEFCDGGTKSYVQNHKYNGKEFDHMHGLNTYDYGARQYNPVTARWDRMDPHCEEYYNVSPYVYCLNNPVKHIDPNGKWVANALGALTGAGMEYASQVVSNIVKDEKHEITLSKFTDVDLWDIGVAAAEGAATCGASSFSKGARVGIKLTAELTMARIDVNLKDGDIETKVHNSKETIADATVGVATGSISLPTNKLTPFKKQTTTQATKSARAKAHSQRKSFTKEQYKEIAERNKKKNTEKKSMNKTATDWWQHFGGAIDGTLQGGYEKVKQWFGFGD